MPTYIIAYRGTTEPETPEAGAEGRAKWQAWLAGLGDAVVNPGTPLKPSKTVTGDTVTDTDDGSRLNGFTMITADSLEAAVAAARACPYLEMGAIEVAEVVEMG